MIRGWQKKEKSEGVIERNEGWLRRGGMDGLIRGGSDKRVA